MGRGGDGDGLGRFPGSKYLTMFVRASLSGVF